MPVSRPEVLQGILNLFANPRYLEIGVAGGDTFHALEASRKVAVDPRFRFDMDEARRRHPNSSYHEMPSDDFFGAVIAPVDRFEVVYLDGLHTAEQTLRDLINVLSYATDDAVIVLDDILPNSYAASIPAIREFQAVRKAMNIKQGAWMGDVYRLVFFIETFFQQFSYRAIQDNHGQLIMWRARRASVPRRDIEEIGRLPYASVILQRDVFRFAPYEDVLKELRDKMVA